MLTGACLGRAGLNRKTGLATLTLVLAAESPDIDGVSYLVSAATGLKHHRGITHSLIGVPVMALLVVGLVYGIFRVLKARGRGPSLPPNWKLLYGYALLGALLHLFQDFTNNYGVRPFAPFNLRWYSWDIVYIVDPFMLLALIAGLVVPALLGLVTAEIGARKRQFHGRGGAILALAVVAALIVVRDFEHRRAVNALNARTYHNEEPLRASAFPLPLNPFSWNGVVETQSFFHMLPVEPASGVGDPLTVDPQNKGVLRFKPEGTPASLAAKESYLGRAFLDWAAYPVVTVQELNGGGYQVQFEDLRFESVEGYAQRRRPPLTGTVVLDPRLHVDEMYMGLAPNGIGNAGAHP